MELLKRWWKLLTATAALVITRGAVWAVFCQVDEYVVSASELEPVLTQVAANSKEIQSLTQVQERAATMSLYESTFNMIGQIQSRWAGKAMPAEEYKRLRSLQLQLKQLELQLGK